MKILLINNGTNYLKNLRSLLEKHGQVIVKDIENALDVLDDYDLVILSGGHQCSVVNHKNYYQNEIQLLKNCKKPLIGICLGAELVAYTFGAKLKHLNKKEKGIITVKVLQNDGAFDGIDNFAVFENHRWAITNLPNILIGMAKSQDGFEIIKHRKLPIYGFQFHPELFQDETKGTKIFDKLLLYLNKQNNG